MLRVFVAGLLAAVLLVPVASAPAGRRPVQQRPAEKALLLAINEVRVENGLAPFRLDRRLQKAARRHSLEMARGQYFDHGPLERRLQAVHARGRTFGENIAWTSSGYGVRTVLKMWMESPPHRANLLSPSFKRIGIGTLRTTFQGVRGARLVTADFAG